jgi:hypothetical protein
VLSRYPESEHSGGCNAVCEKSAGDFSPALCHSLRAGSTQAIEPEFDSASSSVPPTHSLPFRLVTSFSVDTLAA